MKISVYAIAKNESLNVPRWMEAAKEADCIIVTDTGSTDDTVRLLRDLGATVHETTVDCRKDGFDTARNISLGHVPEDTDLCVCLDLDEPLSLGWRKTLEEVWTPEYTMVQYPCIWEWRDEAQTIPEIIQPRVDRIHARRGFKWIDPIHEKCVSTNGQPKVLKTDAFYGRHYQKGQRSYLNECLEALKKRPHDVYLYIQTGAEYLKIKDYEKALPNFIQAMNLLGYGQLDFSTRQMKAISCQSIARCLLNTERPMDEIIPWLIRATAELPTRRESWVYLAEGWLAAGDYLSALAAVQRALAITDRSLSPLLEEECWGEYPEHIRNECIMRLEAQRHAGNHG